MENHVKAPPKDWPRVSPALVYKDAPKAIEWLCQAFDFEVRLKVEGDGGRIEHCELTFGESVFMLHGERSDVARFGVDMKSPLTAGGITQSLMVFVDDVDAHCAKARANGAKIVDEPSVHDYGDAYWADRSYGALDFESHLWWFTQRLRTGTS
jgi:uncharacterized glyoxalase superfamily protein PhnB